jgi:hypothetical protein
MPMMSRRALTVLLLLLVPAGALARDPGAEFRVTSEARAGLDQDRPTVAMDRDGRFVVVWASYDAEFSGTVARLFSAGGTPRTEDLQVGQAAGDIQGPFSVSMDDAGISVGWGGSNDHSGPNADFRRLDRNGSPLSKEIYLGHKAGPAVATDRQGRSIVLVVDDGIRAWRFDPLGRPEGGPLPVIRSGVLPAVVRGAGGRFVAAWSNDSGIRVSLLDASGRPIAPFHVEDEPAVPALASSPDGRFALAWISSGGVRLRLFRASGAPRTGLLHVTEGDIAHDGPVSVAMDAAGRTLVVWSSCDASFQECHVFGRRFENSGKPEGGPFRIDAGPNDFSSSGAAAAGSAGRFVVVWTRSTKEEGRAIYGRFVTWALPGDAPCVHRGNRFLCDLAHDGGEEESSLSFGRGSDLALLGDLDGDGRDDPCVYGFEHLLCDATHDGGAADIAVFFGQDGDVPVLADLDGEGRDDLCVRRGADLLCDSAHNGGTAELIVHFGEEDDLFLMGDVDGDGDDDPCVARSALLCDTEHDGGVAETVIPLDRSAGETVLLGDLDDDGRDDPCLYEAGRFLCDVDHDGSAELVIPFGRPGDQPLLGDPAGL